MTLYCPDKGQNVIDKTNFHDNIIMKYCPGGLHFTGHNFALHNNPWPAVEWYLFLLSINATSGHRYRFDVIWCIE